MSQWNMYSNNYTVIAVFGRTLEAPIPKMSGLVKKMSPFSKRKNPL